MIYTNHITLFTGSDLIYKNNVIMLNLSTLTEDTTIGCGWKNDTGCPKTINIEVFNRGNKNEDIKFSAYDEFLE